MNINDVNQFKNGIKVLTQQSQFYCEKLFVVNQTDNELILMSREYNNDVIKAIKCDKDYSFEYINEKYKIIQRTRFEQNMTLETGFDFQNTIQKQVCDFIEIRQVKYNEKPNTPIIDFPKLCQGNVIIQSDSLKIMIENENNYLKNVFINGNEVVISTDLTSINVQGNIVSINKGCKDIVIKGNDIAIGSFSQNIEIGQDSQKVSIGNMCKNIQIKNVCQNIDIQDYCQNVTIGNQCQNITLNQNCGINGFIHIGNNIGHLLLGNNCANFGSIIIGDDCAKNGKIVIGNDCGSTFGQIIIYQRCGINGNIIIEDFCGYDSGQVIIQPLCGQNDTIYLHQYTGSGKSGKVSISSNCKNVNIDIGQNQSLQIFPNIKQCILNRSDNFDTANFIYFIKKNVNSYLLDIKEYKTIGSVGDDDVIDMFSSFEPENCKVRV